MKLLGVAIGNLSQIDDVRLRFGVALDKMQVLKLLRQAEIIEKIQDILGAPASVTFSVRALFGDVNNDCLIDIFDLSGVAQAFGSRDGELRHGAVYDLNNDRMISIFDVAIVARKFGMRC